VLRKNPVRKKAGIANNLRSTPHHNFSRRKVLRRGVGFDLIKKKLRRR
jgi:hypothetical protein